MSRTPIRLLAASLCIVAMAASACSSTDGDTAAGGDASTSTSVTSTSAPAGDEPEAGADDEGSGSSSSESPCTDDPDYLSGTSTIVFTADAKSPAATTDVTAENTLSLDQGVLTPATLEVDVDEPFAVTSTEGTGITGIVVGCASGQTTVSGVPSGFVITEAGTYDIVDELADETIGTVTVG